MPSWQPHPHLYCDKEGLEKVKAKLIHPRFKKDWEAVRFRADSDLDCPAIEDPGVAGENKHLRQAAYQAAREAFVYRMTGEKKYAARVQAYFDGLLAIPLWSGNPLDCQFGLREGAMALHLGEAYDLVADEMSDAARKTFLDACVERLLKVFVANCKNGQNHYLGGERTMNHLALHASGASCLAIALDGDAGDLSKEIEIARAHLLRFIEWYDDAGASLEIDGYWTYANEHVIRAMYALRNNGWPKFMHQRAKKLERYFYPVLCMSVGGKFVTNFADSRYGYDMKATREDALVRKGVREAYLPEGADPRQVSYRMRTCALALAAAFQDGRIQWFADQLPWGDQFGIIAGDPDLKPAPPDDLPTTVCYHGCGVGVIRSSMTDPDALLLGLKAGRARGRVYDDPHSQFDLNSVVLEAYGEPLLADPGYHHVWHSKMQTTDPDHISNSTPPHNTLLVGGKGQTVEDSPLAHLQDLSPNEDVDYLVSRIERAYGPRVRRYDRHAYCIGKQFFVIVDDVLLREPEVLTWNFHAAEEARLTAAAPPAPPKACRIQRGQATLVLVPFGLELTCKTAGDHLLPRFQFDTPEAVTFVRAGWLLLPHRKGEDVPDVEAKFAEGGVVVFAGEESWELPVVVRRASFRSDIMLPFPERAKD
ncbi:MAG: heparinase II/III-family protein [Planctomycetes bacterium]|nr:heparinase II/III-family protein [Planctomycetota bacterium]